MTEVMLHSAVGESFSFSESKFKEMQSENKSQMLIEGSNELDESTISDKMDSDCDYSSGSTICESNSINSSIIDDIQDSCNGTEKGNIFRKDFKFVATETTVINATYNVISKSPAQSINKSPPVNTQSSESWINDRSDKSRVIVQILTSDAKKSVKSQDIIENKSITIENQSTHSFREDVFKILSKPQSSNIDLVKNTEETEIQDPLSNNEASSFQINSSQEKSSTQINRNRRKRSLKSFFLFGGGPKLSDIKQVCRYLHTASPRVLRIVHYILYDRYGLCSNNSQIYQTKKNIYRFCGYPFDQKSPEFLKKKNCLKKVPRPMLNEIHRVIFGKTSFKSRELMVDQLLEFFLKPKKYHQIIEKMKHKQVNLSAEYDDLKNKALKGPLLSVSVKRLKMDDIERIKSCLRKPKEDIQVENADVDQTDEADSSNYSLPAYILNGPGKKLKFFLAIMRNVKNASEKDVNLLHYILYGRMDAENIQECRRNILEFSGFLECQTDFIAERKATLMRLDKTELLELCKMLCLRGKTSSKNCRIRKIMDYLQAPYNPIKIRGNRRLLTKNSPRSKFMHSRHKRVRYAKVTFLDDEEVVDDGGCRLRDFKKICSNIECSAPSDLTELNDLLFAKPCDETEIHEKILNFTRFGFTESSIHYHYRKTLIFYMGPCIIRKIAKLLDIENMKNIQSHEDLSSSILNFLMERKNPDLSPSKSSSLFSVFSSKGSFMRNLESHEKQSLPENFQNQSTQSFNSNKGSAVPSKLSSSFLQNDLHNSSNEVVPQLSKSPVNIYNLNNRVLVPKPFKNTDACSSSHSALVPASKENTNDSCSPDAHSGKEDSIPLRVFIHHPTDQELKEVIHSVIKENLWHITLGDLVQKVYQCYPKFNLMYRESFIKTEAIQILSELRSNACNVIHQMRFSHLPM